jgi:hypothetical protein
MNNDFVFSNWQDAAANAGDLLDKGHIDLDEYNRIVALARKERASMPVQAAPGQPPPAPGQVATPGQSSASGRAAPVQSVPTWEEIQRFMRELMGPRPAY